MRQSTKQRDMTPFEGLSFRETLAESLPGVTLAPGGLVAKLIDTPVDAMVAVADDKHLHVLEFFDRKIFGRQTADVLKATGLLIDEGENRITDQIRAELEAFFNGTNGTFQTPLKLHGTDFVQSVWRALQQVPVGETRSYGALSNDIGNPKAVRAVAQANGANRLAIILPCHRIIGADGSLTGYGGGLWRKQWLLEHEGRYFGNRLL